MIGIVRGLITLALLSSFIGLVVWAYGSGRKETFDAMALLPLEDEQSSSPGSERA